MSDSEIAYFTPVEQSQYELNNLKGMLEGLRREYADALKQGMTETEFKRRLWHLSELCSTLSHVFSAQLGRFETEIDLNVPCADEDEIPRLYEDEY